MMIFGCILEDKYLLKRVVLMIMFVNFFGKFFNDLVFEFLVFLNIDVLELVFFVI